MQMEIGRDGQRETETARDRQKYEKYSFLKSSQDIQIWIIVRL